MKMPYLPKCAYCKKAISENIYLYGGFQFHKKCKEIYETDEMNRLERMIGFDDMIDCKEVKDYAEKIRKNKCSISEQKVEG